MKIAITDIPEVKECIKKVSDLVKQIEKSNFKDENGYCLKNNKCYLDLINFINTKLD